MKVLALDAMGVLYPTADDVKNLLVPFIAEKNGSKDMLAIERLYHSASLGHISAYEFWEGVGLDAHYEDEYLQRHTLTDGLIAFLELIRQRDYRVWCLSNDLSEWSRKLRLRFGLERFFEGFVISADAGARKPDPAIYHNLIERLHEDPRNVTFVDDNHKNLDTASTLGFHTILFSPVNTNIPGSSYTIVRSFDDLAPLLP